MTRALNLAALIAIGVFALLDGPSWLAGQIVQSSDAAKACLAAVLAVILCSPALYATWRFTRRVLRWTRRMEAKHG